MVKIYKGGAFLINGTDLCEDGDWDKEDARKGTIAYSILKAHNTAKNMEHLKLRFDSMASHDITFVGIVQTAKASGMEHFPLPYVLTNCHNSLCAVGGTINEDDHVFGLSAAKKYGGIYVPPHIAVIHQYMREMMAGCGRMILGSDSHTRYGALGTLAIGEGGGELVKQLLSDTYDVDYPEVVAVYLKGSPAPYVGPQDIALSIIGEVFKNGYVKNKVMEFVGPGVASMTTDFRNGVDVMTTETTCLSSVWITDEDTREYLTLHGRGTDYKELKPADTAYYDGVIYVDLSKIEPMIALPFHPGNTFKIDELNDNLTDILRAVEKEAERIAGRENALSLTDKIINGRLQVQQGIIAGCAGGGYTNIIEASHALKGKNCGNDVFSLSVYPSSQPVFMDLLHKGAVASLMEAGAVIRTAFCGPCFGAGDTPANNCLSVRHTTRNFPNREGSKPGAGQMSGVALMDARSIAATAARGGLLTSAKELDCWGDVPAYHFDDTVYKNRVYYNTGLDNSGSDNTGSDNTASNNTVSDNTASDNTASDNTGLVYGPGIRDWPDMGRLTDTILLKVCAKIMDEVTTTDELIPSGETSSYRSDPLRLAEFTLSRREPQYVDRAKAVDRLEKARMAGTDPVLEEAELREVFAAIRTIEGNENICTIETEIGSMIYAVKPGDGSAREQAASCQRVLGGLANIAGEYATKRYRSNMINWGLIPFLMKEVPDFEVGDYILVPGIRAAMGGNLDKIPAYVIDKNTKAVKEMKLHIADMTMEEREIVKAGSLINYNRTKQLDS